jgi:predicted permease
VLTIIGQDFRYALRALARRPTYAAITILVLAIAIGANTTVFSVLNALLLRPLPYPDGDRLVEVYDSYPKMGIEVAGTAIPDYIERRQEAKSLESLAIMTTEPRTLGAQGDPERVRIARASPSLFTVLRTPPKLGRAFTEDEATLGNDRVAVLSDRLWRTRFGANPNITGLEIRLDGDSFRVIGVMPAGFGFPTHDIDAWTPFAFTAAQMADSGRGNQFSQSIGRLRDGATLAALNAELATIVNRNVEAGRIPRNFVSVAGFTGRAKWLRDTRVGALASMVYLLQATVLAVLLIACANVANLQLARVATRRRELAVRTALGAPGARLARLVLIESFLLALAGALAGLLLASGGLELVRALGLDRSNDGFEFRLDTTVLVFTLGAGVLAALVAGLPPLVALLRDDLIRVVHEAGRLGGGGRSANAMRSALIVVQIGLSVALLAGAGLLTKNFYRLESQGPGFNPSSIWTAGISLPRGRYPTPESWAQFEQRMLVALRALPGVSAAGFTSILPFSNSNTSGSYDVEGYEPPAGMPPPHGQQRSIDEQYFPALGIQVVQGRNFAATEPERVAIVDTNVARKYWPDGNALGQRLHYNPDPPDRLYTIVGVVSPVKQMDLAEEPKETVYWHYEQRPVYEGRLALRTTLPPDQLTRAAKAAISQLDPELALFNVEPLDLLVQRSLGIERAPMVLTLVFAAVAFTLAVIGIYGVLTWAVTQRFAEIGVRLALGAQVRDIVRMVVLQGGKLIAVGAVFGIIGAAVIGRVLASQVPGVAAVDPAVIAGSVVALAVAALIATWLPARRAGRTDPMVALRAE